MVDCKDLPELTLNVKDDQNEVFKLLKVIKPDWKKDQVDIKVLSGGYSCVMLRCRHDSGESVTVRVRHNLDGLRDPADEILVLKVMSSKGLFPPLLATFQNGFCYEYIPGRPFVTKESKELVIDLNQTKLIAYQMANIHATVIPELDFSRTSYFDFFKDLLSTSKPWFEGCPPFEELSDEINIVQELASEVASPLVLCHCDPHPANFVWNEEENKMTFVDWELTQVAHRGVDIAYFLNSIENFGNFLNCKPEKPDNFERAFCEFYLQQWNKLQGKSSPTTEELERLLLEYKYFKVVVDMAWMIYFVKFDDIMPKLGEVDSFWKRTYERYLTSKENVTGITKLGRSKVN